jgi:GT2 family glycosyltransferase
VLNWNGWDDTLACLRSLRQARDVTAVWLVDNGSDHDRSDEAVAIWPGLRVLHLDRNYGFAGGMNRALQVAVAEGHEFAYLLNNDCIVKPGFLRVARAAAAEPNVAVVGSWIAHAGDAGSVLFDGAYYLVGEKRFARRSGPRAATTSVNGAGMLVRLAALERHGYFDERYFCYHEEVELCGRLGRFGWVSVIASGSLVLHKRRGSDVGHNSLYYRTRNRFLLVRDDRGWTRVKRTLLAFRSAALLGRRARRDADAEAWEAVAAAVYDGMYGRFGRREDCDARTLASVHLRVLCTLLPVKAAADPPLPSSTGDAALL